MPVEDWKMQWPTGCVAYYCSRCGRDYPVHVLYPAMKPGFAEHSKECIGCNLPPTLFRKEPMEPKPMELPESKIFAMDSVFELKTMPIARVFLPHETGMCEEASCNGTGTVIEGYRVTKRAHDEGISTVYGHMSRFASERVGQRVSQGQTIGYVGMTGLATGPHLHYEFRVDGVHRNPLTVTLPKPEPLPATELARFKQQSAPVLAKLDKLDSLQLASAK